MNSDTRTMNSKMAWMFLLVAALHVSQVSGVDIPDKSLMWSTGSTTIYYNPEASNWTNAQLTPTQFVDAFKQISTKLGGVYGLTVDARKHHLMMVVKQSRSIAILDLKANLPLYFHMGTSPDIGQLAVDWRGRNVYWTDTGYGWIGMKKLPQALNMHDSTDHRFKVIVDKYLQRPTGIAVHPHKFFLFWADKGGSPQIERSDLTGNQRTIIIWQGMISPTALCIDIVSDRLYWSDPGRGTVEYSDLDGNGRNILMSDPSVNYYGIAIFQDSLVYTAPVDNRTGYVSLRENNEGEHLQAILQIENITFYHVLAYDTDLQPRENSEHCDTDNPVIACQQMCLHMPQDQGRTCLCYDGYDLILGQNCTADEKIIQRHILFTNKNEICALPISVLGFEDDALNQVICDVVLSEEPITRFSLDMTNKVIFFTDGSTIYKQKAFKTEKTTLYNTTSNIIDMDYDWKTHLLYWIQTDDRHLYYTNVDTQGVIEKTDFGIGNAISIAVDPHNRQIFWVANLSETSYRLYKWIIDINQTEEVPTTLLSKPTDLEYDRIRNRLLWNDNSGYIGIINVDSTGETKHDLQQTTGEKRFAVAMYKNYILSTSEEDRQFEVIYELDLTQFHMSLSNSNGEPVQDLHVYESSLQPSDLEPCEKENNGGCEHICVPDPGELKCECLLGYILAPDRKSCTAEVLKTNYYVAMDSKHGKLYQIDRTTQIPHAIEIDDNNAPSSIAFDSVRKMVVWVDRNNRVVKKKELGTSGEIAMKTGVDINAAVAVDVSTGNIFVSTYTEIRVINAEKDSIAVVDGTVIQGTVGKLTLQPNTGRMAWFEHGSATRIVLANMDGSKPEVLLAAQYMEKPEDLAFDLDDQNWLYWCDSKKDTVSRIDLKSFLNTDIYKGRGLNPVAIDIVGLYIYLVPRNLRKIVRLNKNTGQDQEDVFESPLFGTFTNFFLFRDDMKVHTLCGICNGGCSNICLPTGITRRCSCSDGVNLQNDGVTCTNAAVCKKDTYTNIEGLEPLSKCCPTSILHHEVCTAHCLQEYELSNTHIACNSGQWNYTLTELCKKPGDSLPIVYIAAGAGGGAIIIIIIVAVCVFRKRKGTDKLDSRRLTESSHADSNGISPYASAYCGHSPDPPPRPEEVQEEEYHFLNEGLMVDSSKLTVDLSQHPHDDAKLKDIRSGAHKDRYSVLPGYNNDYAAGYITPLDVQNPPPPNSRRYTEAIDETDDGYLAAKSVSGGSLQENISGGSFDQITIRYDRNRNASDGSVPLSVRYLPQNEPTRRQPPSDQLGGVHGSRSVEDRSGSGYGSERAWERHLAKYSEGYTGHV